MTCYCFSLRILFDYKNPLNDTFGYIHESLPISEPGFKTTLHPICVLSPIIAPNFIIPVLITVFYIVVAFIGFPSRRKFEVIAPAEMCPFVPKIESPI